MDAESTLSKYFNKDFFFDYSTIDKHDSVVRCMLEGYLDYLRAMRKFPYPRWKDGKIVRFYFHTDIKKMFDELEEAPF